MAAPRPSRLPKFAVVTLTAVVSAALVVTAGPATLAAADRLITGQDIADRSIQKMDLADGAVRSRAIRKESVKSHDIRNGTIKAEDLDAGLEGVVGPMGPVGATGRDGVNGKNGADGRDGAPGVPGAPGAPGPSGQAKPDGVATWTVHYEADGTQFPVLESTDTVPPGALIEPLAYTVDGDFSSCDALEGGSISFHVAGGNSRFLLGASMTDATDSSAAPVQTVSPAPSILQFRASCHAGAGMGMPVAVPTLDATLTFQWTVRDTTPTRSFN